MAKQPPPDPSKKGAAPNAEAGDGQRPQFDLLVCQGRLCTSAGADRLFVELGRKSQQTDGDRLRVRRGGCFGLCELSPNLVVRRYEGPLPDDEADLLTLSLESNEWAYCTVEGSEVSLIVDAHLISDTPYPPALRAQRERELPPKNPVQARLRRLRERMRKKSAVADAHD